MTSERASKIATTINNSITRINKMGIPVQPAEIKTFDGFGFMKLNYTDHGIESSKSQYTLSTIDNKDYFAALIGEIYNSDSFDPLRKESINNTDVLNPHNSLNNKNGFFHRIRTILQGEKPFSRLAELNGCFNVIIYKKTENTIFIITDRHATIPVFALHSGNNLFIGTEAPLLVHLSNSGNDLIDQENLIQRFTFGYILGDGTLIKHCQTLPGAHVIQYKDGKKVSEKKYWDYEFSAGTGSVKQYVDDYFNLFKQAVGKSTKNRRVVVPLSGGKDSRTIAMAYDSLYNHDSGLVTSFTYGESGANDLKFGSAVAESLQWPHLKHHLNKDFPVKYGPLGSYLSSGIFGSFAVNGIELCQQLKQMGELLLIGTAGDVLTGAFLSENFYIQRAKSIDDFAQYMLKVFNVVFPVTELNNLFVNTTVDPKEYLLETIHAVLETLPRYQEYADLYDHFNLTQRHRKWLHIGTNFWKSYISVHMPFYDYDLFHFLIQVPISYRKNQKITRETLKKYYPALADIPDCRTGIPLKAGDFSLALWRLSKNRYARYLLQKTPWDPFRTKNKNVAKYSEWIKTNLRQEIMQSLGSGSTSSQYLNTRYIDQILDEHMSGRRNRTSEINSLLSFEYVCRLIYQN